MIGFRTLTIVDIIQRPKHCAETLRRDTQFISILAPDVGETYHFNTRLSRGPNFVSWNEGLLTGLWPISRTWMFFFLRTEEPMSIVFMYPKTTEATFSSAYTPHLLFIRRNPTCHPSGTSMRLAPLHQRYSMP
jgi:hypothetical protein